MAKKVMILSVGGSCEPLVNAIEAEDPDFVYFFCSADTAVSKGSERVVDGAGNPCKGNESDKPSIVYQVGLAGNKYAKFSVENPDDLIECYRAIEAIEKDMDKRFSEEDIEVIVNYTGGTKTMSAALVLYAVTRRNWDLQFNVGIRKNLVRIEKGDLPTFIPAGDVSVLNAVDSIIKPLLSKHYYAEAAEVISSYRKEKLSSYGRRLLSCLYNLCCAFDAWDRFEYAGAINDLSYFASHFRAHLIYLKRLIRDGKVKVLYYEPVMDLMRNAERRAVQKRYDDAVARMYRALELMAQIRLKSVYNIETSRVELEKVPEELRRDFARTSEEGIVKIGLTKAYELLSALDDELGRIYSRHKDRLLGVIGIRNSSKLAHGDVPVSQEGYERMHSIVLDFIFEGLQAMGIAVDTVDVPEFPGERLVEVVKV